jgi:hypothetical protein
MLNWLARLLGFKGYRVARPWETPPEIRKKLRCAIGGIDPASVTEPQRLQEQKPMVQPVRVPPAPLVLKRAFQRGSP